MSSLSLMCSSLSLSDSRVPHLLSQPSGFYSSALSSTSGQAPPPLLASAPPPSHPTVRRRLPSLPSAAAPILRELGRPHPPPAQRPPHDSLGSRGRKRSPLKLARCPCYLRSAGSPPSNPASSSPDPRAAASFAPSLLNSIFCKKKMALDIACSGSRATGKPSAAARQLSSSKIGGKRDIYVFQLVFT